MTLVFERVRPAGPVTHAFVVGCGRFPHLSSDQEMDRAATVAGARQVVAFLVDHMDAFVAPLATIECLISDPATAAGTDEMAVPAAPDGSIPARVTPVDAVLEDRVKSAGGAWLGRLQPGDHMFFYMASHGVAVPGAALGLFEDALSNPHKKWSQSLNVTTLSMGLHVAGAERAWVFLDACQEVVPEMLGQVTGTSGIHLIDYGVTDLVQVGGRKPVALAGSRLGASAWAPTNGDPPYFTQALLVGLSSCCVEPIQDLGWAVTGEKLLFSLGRVAEAALNWSGLEAEALYIFHEPGVALLRVPDPKVPVKIRTNIAAHLVHAASGQATCDDPAVAVMIWPKNEELSWRFEVEANTRRQYTASFAFPAGGPAYRPRTFDAMPPAQVVVLQP